MQARFISAPSAMLASFAPSLNQDPQRSPPCARRAVIQRMSAPAGNDEIGPEQWSRLKVLINLIARHIADGEGERLQKLYVDSKHMDQMIDGGKLPTEATAAIWITNEGLESSRAKLSFEELVEMLLQMRRLSERHSAMSPPAANSTPNPDAPQSSASVGWALCGSRSSMALVTQWPRFQAIHDGGTGVA
ncbi:MAG: hypothetical protein EXR28_06525 [Betaproteobacteria bacterium]|nr:hypothetical protein [Betaproteobacteria bacterium]